MIRRGTEVHSSTTPTKNCHQSGQTDKETASLHPSYQMSPQVQTQHRDPSPRDHLKTSPCQNAVSHSHNHEEISCPAPQELPSTTFKHGELSTDVEEIHTDHPLTVFDSSPSREWSKSDPQSSPFPIPMIKWSEALRQNQDLKLPSHLEGHTVSYKQKNLWAPDILPVKPCKLPSQSSNAPSKLARSFDSVTPPSMNDHPQSPPGKEIQPTKNICNEIIDQQGNQRASNNKSELRRRGTVRRAMEQETNSFEEQSAEGERSKLTSHPQTKRQKVTAEDLCRGTNDFLRVQQQIEQRTLEQVQNAMQETEKLMGSRVWDLDRIKADARAESSKQKSSHRFRSTAAGFQDARARDHISDPRTRIKSEPMDYYLSGHGEGQHLDSGYQDLPVSGRPRFKIELGASNKDHKDDMDLSRTRHTSYSSWVPSERNSMSIGEGSLTYIRSSPEPQLSSDKDYLHNTERNSEKNVENEPKTN
jgi:hypothetical protein